MAASASMVLDDLVKAKNLGACAILVCVRNGFFHDPAVHALAEPVIECVLVAGSFFKVVGVAALNHFAKNGQHLGKIIWSSFADLHIWQVSSG